MIYRSSERAGRRDMDGYAGTVLRVDGTAAPYMVKFDKPIAEPMEGKSGWHCREEHLTAEDEEEEGDSAGDSPCAYCMDDHNAVLSAKTVSVEIVNFMLTTLRVTDTCGNMREISINYCPFCGRRFREFVRKKPIVHKEAQ